MMQDIVLNYFIHFEINDKLLRSKNYNSLCKVSVYFAWKICLTPTKIIKDFFFLTQDYIYYDPTCIQFPLF